MIHFKEVRCVEHVDVLCNAMTFFQGYVIVRLCLLDL